MSIDNLTGENLAKTILRGFEECRLDVKCLRGQGYDGAASMSGLYNERKPKL